MSTEIERKFLVKSKEYRTEAYISERIVQGYLSSVPERSVRIRIKGERAYLTVKGIGNEAGTSRFEWEKEIAKEDAEQLMPLCEPGVIDKVRYYVREGARKFEVDEFGGENRGLVIAEIELHEEDEAFGHPLWLGKEVTGDERYYNASLSKKPYKIWKEQI